MLPPQFDVLARFVQRSLDSIGMRFEKIHQSIEEHTAAIHAQQEKAVGPVEIRAEVRFDDSTVRQNQADQQRHQATQQSIKRAAWAAFAAGVIVALVSAIQWYEMRKATNAAITGTTQAIQANEEARERFQEERRPYVWLKKAAAEGEAPYTWTMVDGRGRIVFYIHYSNFGRSAATNLTISASMLMSPTVLAKPRAFSASKNYPPLPPSGTDTLIVASPLVVDGEGFQRWRSIDRSMVVFGRILYEDVSGGRYETGFCIYSRPDNKIEFCEDGNYIK